MSLSYTNKKVLTNTFDLLSPFVYPAPCESAVGQNLSMRKTREGRLPRSPVAKVGNGPISLQSPFSFPVSAKVCKTSVSSQHLVEPLSTQAYSTPDCYHLPTRMLAKPEISCFESDDEDHEEDLRVKKALALASDALAWCTRRRAKSSVSLNRSRDAKQKVRGREATGETQPKQKPMDSVPKSYSHKVQWSGSTANSVTKPYTSLVPMCRETRESTTSKRLGTTMDFGSGRIEAKMREGSSTSEWIGWYGFNPFEVKEASWVSILRSPGPPPACPLPPIPAESS